MSSIAMTTTIRSCLTSPTPANYPTVCLRCAEALDAIDFPPYTASSPQQTT
ncbi:MAG: hypothetical protein ACLQM6_09260 [Acidobacteriaceae bacterium]